MWQSVYEELGPLGLEIVTVALDTLPEKALPFIEAAKPTHTSLIDAAHLVDELFGFVNVPSAVWIDEEGMIVRPPEPAFAAHYKPGPSLPENASDFLRAARAEADAIKREPEKYMHALRDWIANGANSRYALPPDEVLARSQPRPIEEALGAAHFELGQYLYRHGQPDLAVNHFREANRLQPDNWTYRRQAWSMVKPGQTSNEVYGSDWLSDVRKIGGGENYYPPLDMD